MFKSNIPVVLKDDGMVKYNFYCEFLAIDKFEFIIFAGKLFICASIEMVLVMGELF